MYSKYVIQIELATPLYGIMVNLTKLDLAHCRFFELNTLLELRIK